MRSDDWLVRTSDLIEQLQAAMDEHGDRPIAIVCSHGAALVEDGPHRYLKIRRVSVSPSGIIRVDARRDD